MTMDFSNVNSLWGSLIVEELIRNGIDYFVISPGSRSSPLTVAVARNPQAKTMVCVDERGAAFHALGYGRATNNCAVLICTSGTAAANYFPAVIEASVNTVPLLILSGDRPPELRQTGANQTIQQFNLFGDYLRWQFDLPCADGQISPQMVLTTVDQAVYRVRRSPSGPVHLNCMFREPLAPTKVEIDCAYVSCLDFWKGSQQPYTSYGFSGLQVDPIYIAQVAEIIKDTRLGIIVVGQLKSSLDIKAVALLAKKLNWAVFVDVQSGLRLSSEIANAIPYCDQLLLSDFLAEIDYIDTVIQFGNCLVSKRLLDWLNQQKNLNYVMVIAQPFRDDPGHRVRLRIEADIANFCRAVEPVIEVNHNNFCLKLEEKMQVIEQVLDNFLLNKISLDEPTVARLITSYICEGNGLFLASSMPIRDVDMYGTIKGKQVFVGANRGASGIEGNIASATGFSVGLKAPVTLLMGDLAFLHDLNSLALLKSLSLPIIIVVINNNGGGIFSFLPIANFPDVFEHFFGTPHQLKFKLMAEMFGVKYYNPQTILEFIDAYKEGINSNQSAIIEVTTNREENFILHKELQQKIIDALR